MKLELNVIARIKTNFPAKFGIPRQSGLVNSSAKIIFEPQFRDAAALRGLHEFSHLWIIWGFSENETKDWSPTVRPPRLGGNKRVGVFATRSPNRPNPIGISSVKIDKIFRDGENGTVITVIGADLMDGTPIYDIKPYLKYTDSHPDAKDGFAEKTLNDCLIVDLPLKFEQLLDGADTNDILEILKSDPRPHYHNDGRIYAFEFKKYHVEFKVENNILTVTDLTLLKGENNV